MEEVERSRRPEPRATQGASCREDPLVIKEILTHLDRKDACGAAGRLPLTRKRRERFADCGHSRTLAA